MKVIEQSHSITYAPSCIATRIERAGRICYKSEANITEDSAEKFIQMITNRGHHSVLEHESVQVLFITDRGVTHELVRHRLAAYSQESTRYCDYGGGDIVFIKPVWYDSSQSDTQDCWLEAMATSEKSYKDLRLLNWSPQQARAVLPNSLKTEIVMTANLREWLHVFKLRTSKAAHPQMRELMIPLLHEFQIMLPSIFGSLEVSE